MTAGEKIGNYELLELIGSGGMGDVFRAFDVALERQVAIKFLKPALASDEKLADRFRAEAKTLAQLQHPNITQLYDLLDDRGRLGMVMEFAEGKTLERHLQDHGPMPVEHVIRLFLQCLDAFDCAHRQGIVHRDIKPANVMLCAHNRIKVMDFGVACIVGSDRHTVAGNLVGTPRYMSPEQILGADVDPRSDIYGLGILLFEMLTGEPPFRRGSDFAVMRAQVDEQPPTPGMLRAEVPEAASRLVLQALAKSPRERFQSAAEFRDQCLRCLESSLESVMPVLFQSVDMTAQPPPPRERLRHRAFGVTMVGLAVVAAGVAGYLGSQKRPEQHLAAISAPCPEAPAQPREAPFEMAVGAPLSRREVVLLLQAGMPLARMNQVIDKRGVDFVNGAESAAEVLKAGGSHELNGVIALNHRTVEPPRPIYRPAATALRAPAPAEPVSGPPSALQGQSLLRGEIPKR